MAFVETPLFPRGIALASKFGPGYSTAVARNFGGYEVMNQNWTLPLYEGDVIHGVKTQAQFDDLLAFFLAIGGMANGFRFEHTADCTASGSQGTVIALGGSTWQMYKTYTYGAISKTRKITKPRAGVTIGGGGSYTYSQSTGVITKTSGSDPTGWTGTFDVPVRFNTDRIVPEWVSRALYRIGSIPIIELRL